MTESAVDSNEALKTTIDELGSSLKGTQWREGSSINRICPECFAQVSPLHKGAHVDWHVKEMKRALEPLAILARLGMITNLGVKTGG